MTGPADGAEEDYAAWYEERERPDDVDPLGTWRMWIGDAERRGDFAEAESLRRNPPPEPGIDPLTLAPAVLAVADVGGDPGAAIALALAARQIPTLALVITVGDPGGERARFARHLLDLVGRSDVAVVAGSAGADEAGRVRVGGLVPAAVPAQSRDMVAAVRAVTSSTPHLVSWVNHGALTDLAAVLADDPGLVDRLYAVIAAGPLDGTDERPPQFGSDPAAAAAVVGVLREPSWEVRDPRAALRRIGPPSLITADPGAFLLGPGSPLHRQLADPGGPAWARLLGAGLDEWFAQGHAEARLYAALTVAENTGVTFIDDDPERVVVDPAGWVRSDPAGTEMMVTYSVETEMFLAWLGRQLSADAPTAAGRQDAG